MNPNLPKGDKRKYMQFKDKVVLITGAASGIGRGAALAFAKQGAIVVGSDINEKGGAATLETIKAAGGKAIFIKANVADFTEVKNMIDQIVSEFGRLDIAINNAGIGNLPARTNKTTLETWDTVMAVNSTGVFYCMKLEIDQMLQQDGGIIVNTASVAGLRGLPNNVAYSASKHAVVGMTKTAAMEYARNNIRINALCPAFSVTGLFDPEMVEQVSPGLPQKLINVTPMRRFAKAEEQVDALMWLCSEQSTYVTGLALAVDGGLTA